jgi:hypothetical protein
VPKVNAEFVLPRAWASGLVWLLLPFLGLWGLGWFCCLCVDSFVIVIQVSLIVSVSLDRFLLFVLCASFGCVVCIFVFNGEFDPGSGRTLAACLTHASRAVRPFRGYTSGERVSNT